MKKISGTNKNEWLCLIQFLDKSGNEVSKIETRNKKTFEQTLEEKEEIIGIYGDKESDGTYI